MKPEVAALAEGAPATAREPALPLGGERRVDDDGEPCVATTVTAGNGAYTYRVLAYRPLSYQECKLLVWRALKVGAIDEPEPGGVTTLVTRIGRRSSDTGVDSVRHISTTD